MEEIKTSNILTCNNIKPPVEGRCGFFVKRKQRYCKMLPAKRNKFCAEHLNEDNEMSEDDKRKRINCPLDPKHTVFEDTLTKHLKKCNATKKTQLAYYTENINLNIQTYIETEEEKIPLHLVSIEELNKLIGKIRNCYDEFCENDAISENCSYHSVLDEELKKSGNGPAVRKHLLQQASLVNLLQQSEALQDDTIIIEFGAGRGALSHWVQKAMDGKHNTKFLLVDRQHNRNKLDCYHKGEDQGPSFERLNIDIQHLNLGNVTSLTANNSHVTAVGKHLCGGATDLSLKCLMDASTSSTNPEESSKKQRHGLLTSRLHSILFALCCYHRCTWSTYVGLEFMTTNGFTALEFSHMTKMAAWSTCGFQRRQQTSDVENKEKCVNDGKTTTGEKTCLEDGDDDEHADVDNKLHIGLGLTSDEQREIGRMCKRLIDHGRISYLCSYGYEARLIQYISRDVTPENISLLVTRPTDT